MFLPKLNVKTQSLMHDYILGTAKKYSRMKLLQDGHGKY